MTSAPNWARAIPPVGAATNAVPSTTVSPANGAATISSSGAGASGQGSNVVQDDTSVSLQILAA